MGTRTERTLTESDLAGYVRDRSDFSFELKVLEKLRSINYECEHSGTYIDPVTKKPRQFDIRAKRDFANGLRLRLAIECKNIGKAFPVGNSADDFWLVIAP